MFSKKLRKSQGLHIARPEHRLCCSGPVCHWGDCNTAMTMRKAIGPCGAWTRLPNWSASGRSTATAVWCAASGCSAVDPSLCATPLHRCPSGNPLRSRYEGTLRTPQGQGKASKVALVASCARWSSSSTQECESTEQRCLTP